MPVRKIYSIASDGYISTNKALWVTARNSATGTAVSNEISSSQGIRVQKSGDRFHIYRSFFSFDSSIIKYKPNTLNLIIKGTGNTVGNIIAVKGSQSFPLDNGDFSALHFNEEYSNRISTWTTGSNTIPLNDVAKKHAHSYDIFKVVLIEFFHDYNNSPPLDLDNDASGVVYSEFTGTSYDPYIEYEYSANAENKEKFLNAHLLSGSKETDGTAQKAAVDKNGVDYNLGSNASGNVFTDKNGKVLKQNNVVKFTPSFLRFTPGNWQMFPSASAGRTEGDGEVVLVNDTYGWNFKFDSAKHKNFTTSSFIEFVDDGPT